MPQSWDRYDLAEQVAELERRMDRHAAALISSFTPMPAAPQFWTVTSNGVAPTLQLNSLPLAYTVILRWNDQTLSEANGDFTVDTGTGLITLASGVVSALKATPAPADQIDVDYWTTGDLIAQSQPADTGSYSALVLASSPLGYYRLAEPSGTTMTDSSGNGRDGTYSGTGVTLGTTGLLASSTNTAATFANGSGACPATAAWDVSALTVEAIGKTSVTVNSSLVARWTHGGTQCWNLGMAGSFPSVSAVNSTGTVFTATGSTAVGSAAHHYAATWSGGFLTLYLDGVQVAQTAVTGTLQTATTTVSPLVAARNSGENFWNGVVDEVAIYGTALDAATILSHAQLAGYA